MLKTTTYVKLIIAGFISERDYYDELLLKIKEKGLEDKVTVLTQNNQEDVFRLYSRASLFVLYSAEESQGIVLAEAMAAGLPILATNVGGIPYVIENNINGLLSNYDNQSEFISNIVLLLTDKDLYKRISTINKNSAQKYDWNVIANQILKIYYSISK